MWRVVVDRVDLGPGNLVRLVTGVTARDTSVVSTVIPRSQYYTVVVTMNWAYSNPDL